MTENGTEVILVRTAGGPFPGERFIPVTKLAATWPPPDEVLAPGGKYVKVRQSNLPADPGPNAARGVEYVWRPEGEG